MAYPVEHVPALIHDDPLGNTLLSVAWTHFSFDMAEQAALFMFKRRVAAMAALFGDHEAGIAYAMLRTNADIYVDKVLHPVLAASRMEVMIA
jgi:hypothetical protein